MKRLTDIVARAEPLWERLRRPPPAAGDAALAASRFERWQRRAAGGDAKKLERRLEWAGWRRADVLRVLGATNELDAELPPWAATLEELGRASREVDATASSAEIELPFAPLLHPMVRVASARVTAGAGFGSVSADARASLERSLLELLTQIAAPTLYAEFVKELPHGPDLVSVLLGPPRTRRTARFDAFVRRHLEDGYEGLFLAYPVLARLLATAVDDWCDATSELLTRFASDRAMLGAEGILRLWPGLSDLHSHGRSVVAFETDTGRRLVYKARSIDGEAVFARLVAWCNGRAPAGWLPLAAALVTKRDGYGWMDFVETVDCRDEEAARCFQRIGQLTGLLYVLQSTDVNSENLIIHGEHPVLIDAETLLHADPLPLEPAPPGTEQWADVARELGQSVVRSGLLPLWELHPDGDTAFQLGGLAGADPQRSPVMMPRFHNPNTDSMVLVNHFGELPPNANVVWRAGQALEAADFADDVVCGFNRAHALVSADREGFREALTGGSAAPAVLRYVYRATRVYQAILVSARTPEQLTDGIDFSLELDQVSRAVLDATTRPSAFEIVAAELEALERGDIPYVAMASTSRSGNSGGHWIESLAAASARDRVEESLAGLDEVGAVRQAAIVRSVLDASHAHERTGPEAGDRGTDTAVPKSRAELLRVARSIAGEIGRSAVRTHAGGNRRFACWMGMVPLARSNRYGLGLLGDDLYQGGAGIALFLAAQARVTGCSEHLDLIDEALCFSRSGWKELDASSLEHWLRSLGDGAASGVPSLVYALLRSGRMLGRRDLVESASDLAGLLDADVLLGEPRCDVIAGHAGTVLVLLRLFEETGEPNLLRMASRRGRLLLEHRVGEGGRRAWLFEGKRLAGFGHGASGVAYALVRLFQATSDESFLDAAREGIAYEDSLFARPEGNWRDVREPRRGQAERPFVTGWCHGAPGIGMARLLGFPILSDDGGRADLEVALTTTAAQSLDDADHLCCGNFGRLDLLWTAARLLDRADLGELAHRRASWLLERAASRGFCLPRAVPVSSAPSLFRGAAGVGYQLLRLAAPSDVASVLCFE